MGIHAVTVTVTVAVRASQTLRPVVVWQGTGPRSGDELLVGFEAFPRRQRYLDPERTRWAAEVDVPIGRVVTTARGRWPGSDDIHLATASGLERISPEQAFDMLDPDPARIADRAAQRGHDAAADAERLPKELARFVGAHRFKDGVHPYGGSFVFVERATARQAYWRRATRQEAESCRRT